MSSRFRVAHKQSMAGLLKSWVASRDSNDYKFKLQHNIASMPYFSAFSFHFYSVSSTQVPLQWQQ